MDCFSSLIGMKGICDNNTATYYLDQCGITEEILVKSNYTHDDPNQLLLNKISEATTMVARQVKNASISKMTMNSNLANDRIGHPERTLTTVAAKTGYDAGAYLEIARDIDYVSVNIDSISLFVNTTGNVDVEIYDLTEGRLVQTVTVAALSGEMVYKDVNATFRAQKRNLALAFLYDSSFSSNKTTPTANRQGCGSCNTRALRQNRYSLVSGAKFADGEAKTLSNIIYEDDTAGVSVTYTIDCDYDQWICKSRELLLLACLYYTAYHIAEYALRSDRLNSVELDYRPILEHIRDTNLDNYNTEFNSLLGGMKIPANSDCFVCKRQSTNPITL